MGNELQVALISGPAYDPLYECLPPFTVATGVKVNVAFRGDHPALNHHLATLAEVPYDLVSTHTKYAPSLLEFARVDGSLYSLPRNIDVRLLHFRTDLIDRPPATWDDLLDLARRQNSP